MALIALRQVVESFESVVERPERIYKEIDGVLEKSGVDKDSNVITNPRRNGHV